MNRPLMPDLPSAESPATSPMPHQPEVQVVQNEELLNEVSTLRTLKEQLEKQLEEKCNEISYLHRDSEQLVKSHQEELMNSEYRLDELEKDNADLQTQLDTTEKKIRDECNKEVLVLKESQEDALAEVKKESEGKVKLIQQDLNVLSTDNNQKTDEVNNLREKIDSQDDTIVVLREDLVKEQNKSDCLKQMVDHTQTILQKHETENHQLADKLVTMKTCISKAEDPNFTSKYEGVRIAKMGNANGYLSFRQDQSMNDSTQKDSYLIIEYSNRGDAVKIHVSKIKDVFLQENQQIVFIWSTKS